MKTIASRRGFFGLMVSESLLVVEDMTEFMVVTVRDGDAILKK